MRTKKIVILHGWNSNPSRWEKVKKLLTKKGFSVEIPILPGFDKKNSISHSYTIEDYVEWLKNFIDNASENDIILCGHSHGGRLAIAFVARTKPKKINRLILINPAGIPPRNSIKKLFFKLLSLIGKCALCPLKGTRIYTFSRKVCYKLAREKDYFCATPAQQKTMQNMLQYDARKDCTQISVPTLCVWGKNDTTTPIWMGKEIKSLIPKCCLKILPTGHNPHIENPVELINLLTKYI